MRHIYEPHAYTDAPRAACAWGLGAPFPALDGDTSAEVAVIGGGYTGLSAALHLAQAEVDVALLEAHQPGWGASGRNGGFCCMGGAKLPDSAIATRFGRDQGAAWIAAQRAAIDLVADLLDRHGIDAARHSNGEVILAHRPRHARGFAADAAHYQSLGIAAEALSRDQLAERGLTAAGIHGGLHIPLGFALDPGAYATGLARAAATAGARLHGDSPVTALTRTATGWRLTTPTGTLTAPKLIVATNGYSAEDLPDWMRARLLPVQSNVLVTRPLSANEQAAQGWTSDLMAYDTRALLHYVRLMPDGRFLFGMRGGVRARPVDQSRMERAIRKDFDQMFPAWRHVEAPHIWSGLVAMTTRLTPFVGSFAPGGFAAMGYHGNGVAMGSYAGARIADVILGRPPGGPFPAFLTRPPARFPLGRHRRAMLAASYVGLTLADAL